MKETRKEVITYKTIYEAEDGTKFNNKEECEKYESTAEAVLKSKFKDLVVATASEYELSPNLGGSEEYYISLVSIKTKNDIDTILRLLSFYNSHLFKKSDTEHPLLTQFKNSCNKALKDKEILLIGTGTDFDNYYILGTKSEVIDSIADTIQKLTNKK